VNDTLFLLQKVLIG